MIAFFADQRSKLTLTLDELNSFVSFNKNLINFLIEHQSQVKIQYSPTKSPIPLSYSQPVFTLGSPQASGEVFMFQHQLNKLNFDEYYVNKRKPKRLEVRLLSFRK